MFSWQNAYLISGSNYNQVYRHTWSPQRHYGARNWKAGNKLKYPPGRETVTSDGQSTNDLVTVTNPPQWPAAPKSEADFCVSVQDCCGNIRQVLPPEHQLRKKEFRNLEQAVIPQQTPEHHMSCYKSLVKTKHYPRTIAPYQKDNWNRDKLMEDLPWPTI